MGWFIISPNNVEGLTNIKFLLSGLTTTIYISIVSIIISAIIGFIVAVPALAKNKFLGKGECFVFDNRISLKHGLKVGSYLMCSGCRKPISPKDKKSKKYEEGVSCPNCNDNLTDTQKTRFRMRQKQINLAKNSGSKHIFQKEFK